MGGDTAIPTVRTPRDAWLPLALLLLAYALASAFVLLSWDARGVYTVTGDEPHYLVMADALLTDHSLELSDAYTREFAGNAIFASGLGSPGSPLEPPYAHVVSGPNGFFSWHGPGTSALVAIPFALAGVVGAKVLMVVIGAWAVVLAWWISGVALASSPLAAPWRRFWSVLAICIGYPLVGGSTQLYPDLVAGVVALAGFWLLLTPDLRRHRATLVGYGVVLSVLPWLGTKFAFVEAFLVVGISVQIWRRDRGRLVALLLPVTLSMALLIAFNTHAFGRPTGPAVEGALEVSGTSFMVLWGLLLDQNEGSLLQNPALLLALVGAAGFVRRFRFPAGVWMLTFAAFWLPSAMHPGWYGLGSLIGRYSWAMSILLIIPALFGLRWIAERSITLGRLIIGVLVAFHALTISAIALVGGAAPGMAQGWDLYSKATQTWLESYAVFYFPLHGWLPAFYDASWAYAYLPNAAWLLVALALVLLGWRWRWGVAALGFALLMVLVGGFTSPPHAQHHVLAVRESTAGPAGFMDAALVRQMRQGPYRWTVTYSASADPATPAGEWELVRSDTQSVVASGQLAGTSGATATVPIDVPYLSLLPVEHFLRIAQYGTGRFSLDALEVSHSSG